MATNILQQYLESTTPNPNRNAFAEGIQAGRALRQNRLQDEQIRLAQSAGARLASNDLAGAGNVLARGGDIRNALAVRETLAGQESAANEARQKFAEGFATFAGGILQLPEEQQEPAYKAGIGHYEREAQRLGMNFDAGPMDRDAMRGIAAQFGKLPKGADGESFKDRAGREKDILAAYDRDVGVKEFRTIGDNFLRVNQAFNNPSAAGDLAMIFSFMKMLDPTSVVREGEQATASNAAGVPDRIRNTYNRIMSGERLTPEQRQDFFNQSQGVFQSQGRVYGNVFDQYRTRAERNRLSGEIIPDYRQSYSGLSGGDAGSSDKPIAAEGVPRDKLVKGQRYVGPNGQIGVWTGDGFEVE